MGQFNHFMNILMKKEGLFMCAIVPQLEENELIAAVWPRGYMNDLSVEYEHSLDYISLQGTHCGIRINPNLIAINSNSYNFMLISTDVEKDEFFNMSINEDMYGLKFEHIQYLQNLREKLNNYKDIEK